MATVAISIKSRDLLFPSAILRVIIKNGAGHILKLSLAYIYPETKKNCELGKGKYGLLGFLSFIFRLLG